MLPAIAVIGAGKVASALTRVWVDAGYPVVAIHNRNPEAGQALAKSLGLPYVAVLAEAAAEADLVFLAVADDAIAPLAAQLAAAQLDWAGRAVIHCAGAHSLELLAVLADQGAGLGSFHPALAFADPVLASQQLGRASIAIEASDEVTLAKLRQLAESTAAAVILLPPGAKARYHAALVLLSNYTVTLYAAAEALLLGLGADRSASDAALLPLLEGVLLNLRTQGIPAALTGPLLRADLQTLSAHLETLNDKPALKQTYCDLAVLTRPLLVQRGLPDASLNAVYALIQRESFYEPLDDTRYTKDEGQSGTHRGPDGL